MTGAEIVVRPDRDRARRIVGGVLDKAQDRSLDAHERGAWLDAGTQLVRQLGEDR